MGDVAHRHHEKMLPRDETRRSWFGVGNPAHKSLDRDGFRECGL